MCWKPKTRVPVWTVLVKAYTRTKRKRAHPLLLRPQSHHITAPSLQSYLTLITPNRGFPSGSVVKNPPAMQEKWVQSLGREDSLEKGMATHSSILAWKIHGQSSLAGRPQSMVLQRTFSPNTITLRAGASAREFWKRGEGNSSVHSTGVSKIFFLCPQR